MAEGPYKLPKGWKWVRLGEVCEINPRRPRLVRNDDAPTSFVPMNAVDENTGTIIEIQVRPFAEVKSGYRYFQEGDVLFAKITPCMENGKAAIARGLIDGIGFGSTEFHVLRPKQEVMAEWIWLFVRQERFREDAKANFRGGVGQQRVPQEFLVRYSIPLPPLPEQRRIVARIEELMERVREARRLREEAKKDVDRLMQAALAEVFPRPGAPLPAGWRWVRLGEVCEFRHGGTPSKKRPEFWNGNIPWVSPKDMRIPVITDTRDRITEHALENTNVRIASKNSILVVVRSGILVRTFPVAIAGCKVAFNQDIKAILPNQSVFNPWFLYWALRSLEPLILSEGVKKGVTVHSIRSGFIENLRVPTPSLENQCCIVAYLDQIQARVTALKKTQESTEAELHRLEQAILDQAFKGKL